MREDMDKLIVKGHSVPKDRSNSTVRARDFEDLPERARMKDRDWWNSGPRDHLKPLMNFLKSRVGQPWAKVYAEICEVTDRRSFEGRHLREHVDQMVISETKLVATIAHQFGRHYWEFYHDTEGILREWKGEYWFHANRHQKPDPNQCVIAGRPYLRINGCWFAAEYKETTECREEWDWMLRKTVKRFSPKILTIAKRQLSKKELKALALSNKPGWNWYD